MDYFGFKEKLMEELTKQIQEHCETGEVRFFSDKGEDYVWILVYDFVPAVKVKQIIQWCKEHPLDEVVGKILKHYNISGQEKG